MYREIGSNYWLNRFGYIPDKPLSFDFTGIDHTDMALLSTGRSALSFILEHIETHSNKKVALLPSFTCYSVIQPFINAGYEICYFNVDKNLVCHEFELLRCIDMFNPSVILLHGYFGFNTLSVLQNVIVDVRKMGIFIIEDITQTLYSSWRHLEVDYYIASLRKWGPLPDGGLVLSKETPLNNKPTIIDSDLEEAKLKALHAKYLFIEKNVGQKPAFLRLFKDAEDLLIEQKGYYSISDVSRRIQANLDLEHIKKHRRSNFNTISTSLQDVQVVMPIFRSLPDNVTPFYFPVYVKNDRKKLQEYLADHDIYCPTIWPKSVHNQKLTDEVDWIYEHILAIPCDQRYNEDDMKRIVDVLDDLR